MRKGSAGPSRPAEAAAHTMTAPRPPRHCRPSPGRAALGAAGRVVGAADWPGAGQRRRRLAREAEAAPGWGGEVRPVVAARVRAGGWAAGRPAAARLCCCPNRGGACAVRRRDALQAEGSLT